MPILPILGAIGSIFGMGGKSASDSRMDQNQLQAMRDQTEVSKYGIGQNAQMQQGGLDLQRKGFGIDAMDQRMKQAILADLVANYSAPNVSVDGIKNAQFSGGLRLSPENQAAFGDLNKKALMAAMQGEGEFQGGNILQAPRATPMQQPGFMEKLLGIGGLVGSGMGAVGGAMQGLGGGGQPSQYIPPPQQAMNYDPNAYKVNF